MSEKRQSRKTKRGSIVKIIALEEHFTTADSFPGNAAPAAGPGAPKISDNMDNVAERLKDMDDAGIDMQVLSFIFHGDAMDAAEATPLVRKTNDRLADLISKYPSQFSGFAAVAPQDPVAAADELERAVTGLGLKGAMIFSNTRGKYLDNPDFGILLARAEKLGVPLYLHPTHPSSDMIKPFNTYPILSGSMWGYAAEAGLHAMRLIMSGTFDKYPALQIILGHLGEAIPYFLWRLDNRWLREKDTMYRDDVFAGKLKKKPSQYFLENFYITVSGMFWPPAIQFANTVLGADRIMFAVDYPQESSKEAVAAINDVAISDGDREKICHLNAEKLLSL
jgi:predicted TIM-barrel fold metal-dependent hydrolase